SESSPDTGVEADLARAPPQPNRSHSVYEHTTSGVALPRRLHHVRTRIAARHQTLEKIEAGGRLGEAAALVKALRGARAEQTAPQPLQLGMNQNRVDEGAAAALVALVLEHEDVGEIGEGGRVGDDTGKADLAAVSVEAEGERIVDRLLQRREGDAARPVRARE